MRENEQLYFAYGSNINLTQMACRCPNAAPLMPVVLEGYELTYGGGGVATVIPKEGSAVPGLLWTVTPACERSLNMYEGYPHFYGKADVTVVDPKTQTRYTAMAYVMNGRFLEPTIPSPMYFGGIMEGYMQNKMDTRPLYASLNRVEREIEVRRERMSLEGYLKNAESRSGQRKHKPRDRGR